MDDRPSMAGPSGPADPMAAIDTLVTGLRAEGGLDALVGKLRGGGTGDAVDSWVATGENRPVEPARLGEALGPDTMSRLSGSTGLSIQTLLPLLAAFLPQIIDMLTPDGTTPDGGLDKAAGSVPDLGGILGGLLGGTGGAGGQAGMPDLGGLLGGLGGALGGQSRR